MAYKFNCEYHLLILLNNDVNPRSKFYLAEELGNELKNLILIC